MHIVLFISNLYQIKWNLFALAILVLTISIVLVFLLLGELLRWILCLALNYLLASLWGSFFLFIHKQNMP